MTLRLSHCPRRQRTEGAVMKREIKRRVGRGCWDYSAMGMPRAEYETLVHRTMLGAPSFPPFGLATRNLQSPRIMAADREGCGQEKHSDLG